MSEFNNENEKKQSRGGQIAKRLLRNKKTRKKTIKIVLKVLNWCRRIIMYTAPVLVPIICILVAASFVVNFIIGALGDGLKKYSQECPELVHYYLQDHYREFEQKVVEVTKTEEFKTWVAKKQFDLGYTAMTHTGDYDDAQKVGILKSHNPIAKKDNDGDVNVTTLSEDIAKTVKTEGKSIYNKIRVCDSYIAGYKCFNINSKKEMKLNEWLPLSIAGTGMFSTEYLQTLGEHAKDDKLSKKYKTDEETYNAIKLVRNLRKNLDDLVNWTKISKGEQLKYESSYPFRYYMEDMKSKSDDWFKKDYIYTDGADKSLCEKYGKYKKINKKTWQNLKKRTISDENTEIKKWIENCAIIIANDLYYEYANVREVKDMFLPDNEEKMNKAEKEKLFNKRLEFLERSFEAMAKGDSLEYEFVDTYDVCAGKLINHDSHQEAGEVEINGISKVKINPLDLDGQALSYYELPFKATIKGKNGKTEQKKYKLEYNYTIRDEKPRICISYKPDGFKKGLKKSFNFKNSYIKQRGWLKRCKQVCL